jgi:phospholipid/cholesterol/gamma-HCH transport system substrate-binding protein
VDSAIRQPATTPHGGRRNKNKKGDDIMHKNLVETVMGAIVLLVAGGFLMFFYKTTDIRPASGYTITAVFSKIDGLDTGSPVRVSGVKVGQVLDFALNPETYRAIVRMNINNNIKLPKDTVAVIASAGLLDGKFLTLEPGGDEEMLQPGDQIEFTQSTPGLEQLLGQVIFTMNKDKTSEAAPANVPAAPATAPAHP